MDPVLFGIFKGFITVLFAASLAIVFGEAPGYVQNFRKDQAPYDGLALPLALAFVLTVLWRSLVG